MDRHGDETAFHPACTPTVGRRDVNPRWDGPDALRVVSDGLVAASALLFVGRRLKVDDGPPVTRGVMLKPFAIK